MKRLIIFLLLFAAIKVAGQTTGYLRFDTVKIMKQNGTCELYIINKTKDSLGILTNVGGGLTQFRKSRVLNDSTIVVGLDTLVIIGGAGGGGGSGSVTSISQGYGIVATPNPLTSTGTIRADTSGTNGLVTRTELLDSTDITTQVESPIYVKLRSSWPVPDTLALDSTIMATRARAIKISDSVVANRVKYSDTATMLSPYLRRADTTAMLTPYLNDAGWGLAKTGKVVRADSGAVASLYNVNNSGRTYPDEGDGVTWITVLDQSAWTTADLGAQFSRGANHTISLNGSFPRIASSTIVWGGASVTRFLPNHPTIATADSIVMDYQIVTANVGFGLTFQSNNVNGANFGYTMYYGNSASPGSTNLGKQDGTSTQTSTSIAWTANDIIRQTMSFRDTILVVTFQNLTTGSAISTITKSFVAGVAPYPPNTGTWGFQNFSGTYEIRRVKIMTRKVTSPTLMVAFDSKGQIIAAPWNLRFPNLLNARYPTVLNYSGGGDQLKDLIDKKIEFSRLNPEQVLIGLGSNDLRYGSSLVTTLDRVSRVARMVSGSTTRWAITVVPEDSTAGGLSGLTALKNNIASAYPNNYIDLWTFMSTSNVLKAEFNSGDGIHPNTRGHFVMDSLIAASGFFSVQSVNRRSPYQKFGGGIWATGDSLYGPFKTPLPINSMLKFNDSNQVTQSILFENGSRLIASLNYPHAPTPTAGTIMQVDGGFSVTSNTGFIGINDKTNSANRHSFQSDNNILRHAYNGTEDIFIDNNGLMSIGTINSGLTYTPTSRIKKDRTMIAGSVDSRGISFVDDSIGVTMPGGMHSNVYGAKIASKTFTAGSAEHMISPAAFTVEKLIPSTNVTFATPYTIAALGGRIHSDSTLHVSFMDSTTSATGGFVYKDFATGNYKLTGAPAGVTQSALDDTAAAIRADITTPVQNYEMFYSDNSSTTVGNTTTEATLLGTGTGTAQFTGATAGCVLSLKGSGVLSTAGSPGVPTLEFTISNYTAAHNLTGLTGSLTNVQYDYDFEIIPVSIGTNQDAIVNYSIRVNDGASGKLYAYSARLTASFTSSGTLSVDVTADWDAADAANTLTSYKNIVQIFRK